MAIPIINNWKKYFYNHDEGLGSTYERVVFNNLLESITSKYGIKTVLESPSFGFTGVSGINSLNLAMNDIEVTITDNNVTRLCMIEKLYSEQFTSKNLEHWGINFIYSKSFERLPFHDDMFDMSWNFSALWFVEDLNTFLSELSRVTKKMILLIVPNKTGLGYITQKISSDKSAQELFELFNTKWIDKSLFIPILRDMGWGLIDNSYIDCPPWPDIGMMKEEFLQKCGLNILSDKDEEKGKGLSILDYYCGEDNNLPERMMKYYWFEKLLPSIFKKFWAHHHYYLFMQK